MPRRDVIVFSCDGGSCGPDIHDKRVKKSGNVFLVADSTRVTLQFRTSPFNPPVTTVTIAANKFVKKKLAATTGTFSYTITCSACPSDQDDPSMILEL